MSDNNTHNFKKLSMEELHRISVEDFKKSKKDSIIVVLDNVRSLHNIGSIFRTCDAFRVESLYLCGICATPPNRDIHKSALGAELSVDWKYFDKTEDAISMLREQNYKIVSIEQTENSISLDSFVPDNNSKYALIFGHEVNGVDQNIVNQSDFTIEIPQFGTKHSFNVSVTAGIVLWEFATKKR